MGIPPITAPSDDTSAISNIELSGEAEKSAITTSVGKSPNAERNIPQYPKSANISASFVSKKSII